LETGSDKRSFRRSFTAFEILFTRPRSTLIAESLLRFFRIIFSGVMDHGEVLWPLANVYPWREIDFRENLSGAA